MPRPTAVAPALLPAAVLLAGLLAGGLLAACGSTGGTSSSSTTSSTASTTSSTNSSMASSPPPASGTAGPTAPAPPAVANATNLKVAPVPKPGASPAPTRLVKKDLVVGTGATATASGTVRVQYVGANYANGKVFDSSWSRGQPATFPLSGVIPGFAQGIVGMKVGGRREVVIPPALGYGAAGSAPAVGPNETLVFVIDLLAVQ